MPWSGSRQFAIAASTERWSSGPNALRHAVARLCVQVDGIEHRAPDVVLLLAVGAVADPDRAGALVAAQVIQRFLIELGFAADAVHHLQVAVLANITDE